MPLPDQGPEPNFELLSRSLSKRYENIEPFFGFKGSLDSVRTFLLLSLVLSACSQPHIKKYADILEPKIGTASKEEISKILGAPIFCHQDVEYEKCEYRTPRARNTPVAAVYQQNLSLGPDLSPFEQFDVLSLRFDGLGVLRSWHPDQVN